MVREQKLINKILNDGKRKADSVLKKAEKEATKILDEAKQKEADFVKQQIKEEKQKNQQQLEFLDSLNGLEKNKNVLKAKAEIIDEVFASVLHQLQSLKAAEYTKFLNGVLSNAKTGDSLIISSRKGEKEKISKLPIFKTKKLSIQKQDDNITGGLIIVGKLYDLDFSFESLVKEKQENSLIKVARFLF